MSAGLVHHAASLRVGDAKTHQGGDSLACGSGAGRPSRPCAGVEGGHRAIVDGLVFQFGDDAQGQSRSHALGPRYGRLVLAGGGGGEVGGASITMIRNAVKWSRQTG